MLPENLPWNAERWDGIMSDDRLREQALAQCKRLEAVDQAGVAAANSLMAGRSAEVAFAPGNGTRYVFLFVPVGALDTFVAGADPESDAAGPGAVIVADLVNHSVYPISLLGLFKDIPVPSYIAEKWFDGHEGADVFILERLFDTVAERALNIAELRRLEVVK